MINLMYLVFIAMMALNVSSEVLDGFELVEGSLRKSIDNSSQRNQLVADELEAYFKDNPQKVGEWAMKGRMVKKASDSLYNYIQDLKVQIVKLAANLKVPFELTWSCYAGGKKPCGHCDSCKLRAKGFEEAGVHDTSLD